MGHEALKEAAGAPTIEQFAVEAPVVEAQPETPSAAVEAPEAPAVEAPAVEAAPRQGGDYAHQRGPGRTRRGILCMPGTHEGGPLEWTKGQEPWDGTVSQVVGLVTCPACLAVRDGRDGRKGQPGQEAPQAAQEAPQAAQAPAEKAAPAIMATADEVAELASSLVVGGLFLLTQGEAKLLKADSAMVKGVTGLHSPWVPPAEGSAAWPAWKAWTSYLKKLIAAAGGELPAWVACTVATVPLVGAVAMLKGTAAPKEGDNT